MEDMVKKRKRGTETRWKREGRNRRVEGSDELQTDKRGEAEGKRVM